MAGTEPNDIRISDTERESALSALGEHMSTGRLDVDEYGERSAKVATAKTRGDLRELFLDLPDPHPTFDGSAASRTQTRSTVGTGGTNLPAPGTSDAIQRWQSRPAVQRLAGAAVPVAAIVAVVLFFSLVHIWWIFLLPAAVVVLSGAMFGDGWKHDRRAYQRARAARRSAQYTEREERWRERQMRRRGRW
ncbi:MAG TPA: DUF1707 domain-containing protein [Pseudonocardiaceae bacterium]